MERIERGDIVRHFKGNYYKVLSMDAIDTETDTQTVVYQNIKTGQIYCRPYLMFMSQVDTVKYPNAGQEYRFERAFQFPMKPLSLEELKHQQEENGKVVAVTSIDLEDYLDCNAWDRLNDDLSKQITGSCCGLTDICMLPIGAGGDGNLIVEVTANASDYIAELEEDEDEEEEEDI